MPASRKENILSSLQTRLQSVTSANGYDTDIQNVFLDKIPLGLDLDEHELPGVLILDGKDTPKHQHQWLVGQWLIELQLIHLPDTSDADMQRFVRDISKAIYADSATLQRNGEFRKIGDATEWKIVLIEPDVNMMDANRFACVVFEVNYHCHPTDL